MPAIGLAKKKYIYGTQHTGHLMLGLVSMHMPFSTPKKGEENKKNSKFNKNDRNYYDIINSRGNTLKYIYIYIYIYIVEKIIS